jgi:aminopeptidase N
MKKLLFGLIFISTQLQANDTYPVNKAIDVLAYRFLFVLSDSTDIIKSNTRILISFLGNLKEFEIDLVKKKPNGKGMVVLGVEPASVVQSFVHMDNDRIKIILKNEMLRGTVQSFEIKYEGIPEDGLIIGNNKFGDRVFFGDNWPDRGHYWLACVDHPSDKAAVEFAINAPDQYQVVATGTLVEESNIAGGRKITRWQEETPVPVKVMTMGIGRFAVELSSTVNGIPVTTWVYPQERNNGFNDFKVAPEILAFFDRFIGPYSYDKLAHVQSKTRWGGLENAGNIFYFENVVNGKNERESLIAHETAHQWFGNSVTENDWHHVWLSEGFATYLTHVFMEHKYGDARRRIDMGKDREEIMKSQLTRAHSIVDTTITALGDLLSINTYQKAAWVLHMLRVKVGDEAFWKGVRAYYKKYQNQNALTIDFQREVEAAYGKPLDIFFKTWLYQSGSPEVVCRWAYNAKTQTTTVEWRQPQKSIYDAQLTVAVHAAEGEKPQLLTLDLNTVTGKTTLKTSKKPIKVVLDPDTNLLFSGKIEH